VPETIRKRKRRNPFIAITDLTVKLTQIQEEHLKFILMLQWIQESIFDIHFRNAG